MRKATEARTRQRTLRYDARIEKIASGEYDAGSFWYPEAKNATIHPMVAHFFNMSPEQIAWRYSHLNPNTSAEDVLAWIRYQPKYYFHSGSDLIYCTTASGRRKMVVIENNSSPSGQKSTPLRDDFDELGGYHHYIAETFAHQLKKRRQIDGVLAVFYDKNEREARGYAAAMAEVFHEEVWLVPYFNAEKNEHVSYQDRTFFILLNGKKFPVRAMFRYVTQRPWNRLPMTCRTHIFNPVISCLAGGRNKLTASKAYDLFNSEIEGQGLRIETPETIWDVSKNEVPLWVAKMGGHAVVKVPYSNAGQGVYTITSQKELDAFMKIDQEYDRLIVQSLIGNAEWSSKTRDGVFYHVGTMPDKKGHWYAFDLRMAIHATETGFRPMAIYARRAGAPLPKSIGPDFDSWQVLGTNLSVKEDGGWSSETDRLMLMDRKGFNRTGVGLDELIQGFIQSLLSTIAIDKLAQQLINQKGRLRKSLFRSLNDDEVLINEIMNDDQPA